jgi:hypothetical protein
MRNRVRELKRQAFQFGLIVGALGIVSLPVRADSDTPSTGVTRSSESEPVKTPMTDRTTCVAPYAVRLQITGFLARQHATEGDTWRSLVEFYSMLNVDDPAWPDDEQGDTMRIGRDIDVAKMMTEAGLYDHAIRILQTSLILACVNEDPQVVQVEAQMQATADLARLRGVAVPDIDMSFLKDFEPIRRAAATQSIAPAQSRNVTADHEALDDSGPALTGDPVPTQVAPFRPAPPPTDYTNPPVSTYTNPPANAPKELPAMKSAAAPQQPMPPLNPRVDDKSEDRSRWGWLTPSRWRQKKEVVPAVSVEEEAKPVRPTTSPAVAPTYCQECNGLHGHNGGNVVVRYNPRTGITHSHVPGSQTAGPMPSPFQKNFVPLQPERTAMSAEPTPSNYSPALTAERSEEQPVSLPTARGTPTPPPVAPAAPSKPLQPAEEPRREAKRASLPDSGDGARTVGHESAPVTTSAPAQDNAPVQSTTPVQTNTPVQTSAPVQTTPAAPESAPQQWQGARGPIANAAPARAGVRVGVAGEVTKPGIFALQGQSTTLAALLRRTGEHQISGDKKTRILRAVDLPDNGSAEPLKDFYFQRLESPVANTQVLQTPIYNQEVVIVDGAGEKPIYVAVMPHFILQVPADAAHSVTSEQIMDQLRVFWPNIRNQSFGVVRYDQWGSAANMSRLDTGREPSAAVLSGGDVIYIDGATLDRSQVIAAAESIAKLAGARLRKQETR